MVLRDWSSGKLARYTQPASPSASASAASEADPSLAEIYAKDGAVLSKLSTRKELRKAGGLVKLRPADVDSRKAVLDASYFVSSDDEGMEADEEDAGTVDDMDEVGMLDEESEGDYVSDEEEGSDDEDEEDDEDEDEDEEDEPASPPRGKRKRALAKAPARPAKRVAFAPEPKSTKQARSAAGSKKVKGDKPEPTSSKAKPAKKPAKAPAQKIAAPAKKIANAAPSKKAAAPAKDGEDAYDFKQFF